MQRMGEKGELRIEMRLGVPGDRHPARKPGKGERQRADEEERRREGVGLTFRAAGASADSLHGHSSSGSRPWLKAALQATA